MIKTIMKDPLFLSQPSVVATKSDLGLGQDLVDTLLAHRETCVGLAANMIGHRKRVIVIMMGQLPLVMFNPEVQAATKPYETEEGCLSLTGSRPTKRYEEIRVRFRDSSWREQTLTLKGFSAQICQHELDHLEGILI